MAANSFMLGGIPPTKWLTRRRVVEISLLVVAGCVLLVAVMRLRSPWVLLGLLVVAAAGGWLVASRNLQGELRLFDTASWLRSRLAVAGRWDDFDPARDPQPWLFDGQRVDESAGVGIVRYRDALACVVELVGGGEGIRPDPEISRWDVRFARVLRQLGRPEACVDQVDVVTLVRPESPERLEGLVDGLAVPAGLEHLRTPLLEAADRMAGQAETTRSWLVLRFDIGRLMQLIAEPPYTPASEDEALLTGLGRAIEVLRNAGYTVRGVVDRARLAGLCRAVLCPDADPDDPVPAGDWWPVVPAWRRSRDGSAVEAWCGDRSWWHATGGFSRDDWPVQPVPSRWLEPLVFGTSGLVSLYGPRVIVAKLRLLSPFLAREIAMSQKTTAAGKLYREQQQGEVNQDEAAMRLRAASATTSAIIQQHEVGVVPQLRVMVSARSEVALRRMREQAAAAVLTMGSTGLTWDRTRPGAGILDVLPLGREVHTG